MIMAFNLMAGCIRMYIRTYVCMYVCTVRPELSDSGLSENLIYATHHCKSPSLLCAQYTLICPTPGLSGTFMRNKFVVV